jgi:hypothetical protein
VLDDIWGQLPPETYQRISRDRWCNVTSGWHLVTGTYDGATARLYVDGTLVASETFTAPPNTSFPLYIGRYYGAGGYNWSGGIDEVRLYNRALTAAEVAALFTSP